MYKGEPNRNFALGLCPRFIAPTINYTQRYRTFSPLPTKTSPASSNVSFSFETNAFAIYLVCDPYASILPVFDDEISVRVKASVFPSETSFDSISSSSPSCAARTNL